MLVYGVIYLIYYYLLGINIVIAADNGLYYLDRLNSGTSTIFINFIIF